MTRRAIVRGGAPHVVAAYLPSNYRVLFDHELTVDKTVVIEGEDVAGWTLDDYVLPRLASGLYFGEEVVEPEPEVRPSIPPPTPEEDEGARRGEEIADRLVDEWP